VIHHPQSQSNDSHVENSDSNYDNDAMGFEDLNKADSFVTVGARNRKEDQEPSFIQDNSKFLNGKNVSGRQLDILILIMSWLELR